MRRRFNAALIKLWTPPQPEDPLDVDRPTFHPENAFDFEGSVRLTIFRETRSDIVVLHVITSFVGETSEELLKFQAECAIESYNQGLGEEAATQRWIHLLTVKLLEQLVDINELTYMVKCFVFKDGPYLTGHHLFRFKETASIPEHLHG